MGEIIYMTAAHRLGGSINEIGARKKVEQAAIAMCKVDAARCSTPRPRTTSRHA